MANAILLFDWERARTRFLHLPDTKAPALIKTRIGDLVIVLEEANADDKSPPLPE